MSLLFFANFLGLRRALFGPSCLSRFLLVICVPLLSKSAYEVSLCYELYWCARTITLSRTMSPSYLILSLSALKISKGDQCIEEVLTFAALFDFDRAPLVIDSLALESYCCDEFSVSSITSSMSFKQCYPPTSLIRLCIVRKSDIDAMELCLV